MKEKRRLPGRILGTAVGNAFEKPATVDYPKGDLKLTEKYRGRLNYDPKDCIGCNICMRDCPTGAVTIKNLGTKEEKDMHGYLNVGKCIFCCQCVDSCPKNCLSFSDDVLLAAFERGSLNIEL